MLSDRLILGLRENPSRTYGVNAFSVRGKFVLNVYKIIKVLPKEIFLASLWSRHTFTAQSKKITVTHNVGIANAT